MTSSDSTCWERTNVASLKTNRERMFFIPRDVAERVLDTSPDAEWRLIFALSRYGGLRCPSEHLILKWGHVNWDRSRLTIPAAKTQTRVLPIFPELRPYLEAVYEQAEPGTEYVIAHYRKTNANLRTQLLRIMERAGVEPWPKLFHNLRATRQTELEESFPSHVVCRWLGNSESIARKHYLQLTDEHFERAVGPSAEAETATQRAAESGAVDVRSGADALQNPVQQPHAIRSNQTQKPLTESGVIRRVSSYREPLRYTKVEDRGHQLNSSRRAYKHGAMLKSALFPCFPQQPGSLDACHEPVQRF
ncbi:tyrosine-type recombinase/integrase [bacterium]|nr:tyrosine-type recombinase/integrase [bacterium]